MIKLVVLVKLEFDNEDLPILGAIWHSQIVRISTQGTKLRTLKSTKKKKFNFEILKQKITSVVMENYESDCQKNANTKNS